VEINKFKQALLEKKEFIYTLELVPGRGSRGKTQDEILRLGERAARSGLFHALSITYNRQGYLTLSANVISTSFWPPPFSSLGARTDPLFR